MTYFGTQVIHNRNDCWKVLPYLPRFARLKLGHQVREGLAVDLGGVWPLLAVVWYTSRVRPSTFRVAAAPSSVNNNTTLTHLLATLHASVLDCYGLCVCDTNTITLFTFDNFNFTANYMQHFIALPSPSKMTKPLTFRFVQITLS